MSYDHYNGRAFNIVIALNASCHYIYIGGLAFPASTAVSTLILIFKVDSFPRALEGSSRSTLIGYSIEERRTVSPS